MDTATGFMGFYSTIISASLGRKIGALKYNFEVMIFDHERIESQLFESGKIGNSIVRRYFPQSYDRLDSQQSGPAELFDKYIPLQCACCKKDLLTKEAMKMAIIVFVESPYFARKNNNEKCKYEDIYFACKGKCDQQLESFYLERGYITKWEDIADIMIPNHYLAWNMAILNRMRGEIDVYSDIAFEKLKQFILRISQYIVKNRTDEQTERLMQLADIPEYI